MKLLLFSIFVFTLSSCASNPTITEINSVMIRIANGSGLNYENIIVNIDGDTVYYGDLESHSKSDYKSFGFAYSYAFVEFYVNDEKYTYQPTDFVGESKLENGKYTYVVTAYREKGNPSVHLGLETD